MFGISGIELFIILAVALLIFGPDELPRIGRIVGQGLKMFNDARQEVQDVISTEILTPEDAELLKDPLGMKSMKAELESTIKQVSDPKYKPVPKNAGMRVATDDIVEKTVKVVDETAVTADATSADVASEPRIIDTTDAASIWGVDDAR